jgi:hypothetical protein
MLEAETVAIAKPTLRPRSTADFPSHTFSISHSLFP